MHVMMGHGCDIRNINLRWKVLVIFCSKFVRKSYDFHIFITSHLSLYIYIYIYLVVLKCKHFHINCEYVCEIVDVNECKQIFFLVWIKVKKYLNFFLNLLNQQKGFTILSQKKWHYSIKNYLPYVNDSLYFKWMWNRENPFFTIKILLIFLKILKCI